MLSVDIPGFGQLRLAHLVIDYNGTLALDGKLLPGVGSLLSRVAESLETHVLTADTFGHAADELRTVPVHLVVIEGSNQADAKCRFVEQLGSANVVAIGNGRNDRKMLDEAALAVALVQREGAAGATIGAADIVATNVIDALELLLNPLRLIATLRS